MDKDGQLKAYASVELLDTMVNRPRIEVEIDDKIIANFTPSKEFSGASKVSGLLGEGSCIWK